MHEVKRHWVVLSAGLALVPPAEAVVRNIAAEARSEVRLFVDGVEDSSDESVENAGGTDLIPPITARANLESAAADAENDGEDNVSSAGVAVSAFRDPALTGPQRNPGEISIEADCYADDPSTRYTLSSSVVERRTVSFSADELGDARSTPQVVNSAVFMSGAIFAWSINADRDLSGLSGEVSFVVRRIDRDENGAIVNETTLVDGTVAVRGGPGGTFSLEVPDDLFVFEGDVDVLPDGNGGLGLPDVDFSGLGATRVAVILEQHLDYGYQATAGEAFELEATFATRVTNLPDGTGVVAVFGRGFDDARRILELGIPAASAKVLQGRLNRAIRELKVPEGPRLSALRGGSPCGVVGFEMLPIFALMATFCVGGVKKRVARE